MSLIYENVDTNTFVNKIIKIDEIEKYLEGKQDFINDIEIWEKIKKATNPDPMRVREILNKALSIETLEPEELAVLINVKDPELWEEMFAIAKEIKKKVYDNRIVTFAPLYCGNLCVNNCVYCGFRKDNKVIKRKKLTIEEIKQEVEVLAGEIGHKRLIVVYGEHPNTGSEYIKDTIEEIYSVKVKTRKGIGQIRRVNVNAAPMSIEELKMLKEVGIGTYQVFQETYHHDTYAKLHPKNTVKHNYQ